MLQCQHSYISLDSNGVSPGVRPYKGNNTKHSFKVFYVTRLEHDFWKVIILHAQGRSGNRDAVAGASPGSAAALGPAAGSHRGPEEMRGRLWILMTAFDVSIFRSTWSWPPWKAAPSINGSLLEALGRMFLQYASVVGWSCLLLSLSSPENNNTWFSRPVWKRA